jgi:hypothetical protein
VAVGLVGIVRLRTKGHGVCLFCFMDPDSRSQWLHRLRHKLSSPDRMRGGGVGVLIPLEAFPVFSCLCCVVIARRRADPPPKEFCRLSRIKAPRELLRFVERMIIAELARLINIGKIHTEVDAGEVLFGAFPVRPPPPRCISTLPPKTLLDGSETIG